MAVVLTALERSSPADPGYGEIQYRQDAQHRGVAWLKEARLLLADIGGEEAS